MVKLALTEEKFSYDGEYIKHENTTMRPRPRDAQRLLDNLHFSWGSPSRRRSAPASACGR